MLVWIGACTPIASDASAAGELEPLVVTRGALEERLLVTGELEAAEAVELLAPRTEGWGVAIRWLAQDGASVREGDVVAELDNTAVLETINDLELAVIQAGIELSSQQAQTAVAEADKRFEVETQRINLAKAELDATIPASLLSRREHQQFLLAVRTTKTALANAEDDLRATEEGGRFDEQVKRIALDKAKRKLDGAREQIDALTLRAPRDGLVVVTTLPWEGRKLQVGDTVWPGLAVAKIPELGSIVVKAQLSDVDDGRVVSGMEATCVVDAWPDRPLTGRVLSVSPVAREAEHQSTRRFFSVVLELQGGGPELRPGLSVKADVLVARHEGELLVPRGGLDTSTEPARAWLASGEAVEVTLGPCDAQRCVVLAGLEEGAELRAGPEQEAAG
ncbi:efflux RND transporter periplasmic adaptor subunit [Paraliomyxa miuraensis]|uniref:efflux RND transporter periplasmic adaptor subunit n=1 Tax=Paraliomyxa miuraensis TaxID=376150 RepID=UPI00224F2ECB|nr:efflux RND transporter periplasmic adaptor subunit [Paraliomyxa miuraensis]MCX4246236.1 efflux RND transporter periplasmic adaptor subunit [Paraliomyxa miuraensis]